MQKEKSSWKKVNIITNTKGMLQVAKDLKNVATAVKLVAVIVN